MIKNKLDFKLINVAIVMVIISLLYLTGGLWIGIVSKLLQIAAPFFFAFVIAYAFYPILEFLRSKNVPKGLAVTIIIVGVIAIFGILFSLVMPLLFDQLSSLFSGILSFIKGLSTNYDLNLGGLQSALASGFNEIIGALGKYVSSGTINVINVSLSYISVIVIALASAVYLLIDMENIRKEVKRFLLRKSERSFNYVKLLDTEMKNYLVAFAKISVISVFEYYFAYLIIGHPNALLLGFLAAIMGIIPYFGGMFNNVVACVTAWVIGPKMFIGAVIVTLILSVLDSNVINPLIYNKSNKVHPVVVIMSVFAGGILFGFIGIVISLPLAILIITTYNFFQVDISDKIGDLRSDKKKIK